MNAAYVVLSGVHLAQYGSTHVLENILVIVSLL